MKHLAILFFCFLTHTNSVASDAFSAISEDSKQVTEHKTLVEQNNIFSIETTESEEAEKSIFDQVKESKVNQSIKDVFDTINDGEVKYSNKARVIVMNKITANSREFVVNIGESANYGRAELTVFKCASIKNTNDHFMLVKLNEILSEDNEKLLFRGWIFSKSLSLSAIEHPIYQLIAVSCEN